jgi:hypothetical protein
MKKEFQLVLLICFALQTFLFAQITDPVATEVWEPVPRKVTPGNGTAPPSDAIVLFDGKNTSEWTHQDGSAVKWEVKDGHMTVKKGTGGIFTNRTFGDCQLHVEWQADPEDKDPGQDRSNSGIFLQNRYEVQVLDSYGGQTYPNGQAGAIYKQHIPLVNACRPAGEWQTYDIIFKAPVFNADGIRVSPGYVTVLHNGVLIQNHVEIKGTTEYIGLPKNIAHGKGPIQLQDHSEAVSYRNIWIREL